MIGRHLFLSLLLLLQQTAVAKTQKELQIGVSFNQLKQSFTGSPFFPDQVFIAKRFVPQPCIRFSLHFNIYTKDSFPKITISPFIGYHIFGGATKSDTSKYRDRVAFHTAELGLSPSFHLSKLLSVGLAAKLNFTPLTLMRSYGTVYQSDTVKRIWYRENISDRFKQLSTNVGIDARYRYQRFTLQAEAWFGITNLYKSQPFLLKIRVNENNYRLLIGYEIGNRRRK